LRRSQPAPAILWIDDRGKWAALQNEAWLAEGAGFLREPDAASTRLCCLDARGWGETRPEHVAYDLASWNDITRILSYLSIALDRPLMGGRVQDALAALEYLRARDDVEAGSILVGGRGAGALVALFASLVDSGVCGFIGVEMLAAYRLLIEDAFFTWTHDVIVPGLLEIGDVPEFLQALPCPALVINPVDARRTALDEYAAPTGSRVLCTKSDYRQDAEDWTRRVIEGTL
jgi:hypothetical protein